MGVTNYGKYSFVPIRSSECCPICGSRKGRCSLYINSELDKVIYVKCKYQTSSHLTSDGYYKHYMNEVNKNSTPIHIKDYKQPKEISHDDLVLWDKVYRKLRSVFRSLNGTYLYKEHYQNLIERGFDDAEIANMGFFSVPRNEKIFYDNYKCNMSTAIVKELLKTFTADDLIKVPGFSKRTNDKGIDYVVLKTSQYDRSTNKYIDLDAYFIPYLNPEGLLVGMQYRLMKKILDEKGKPMRYLWYVSKGISCGSPIDYYIPMKISYDDVILISEGAIKTRYAASHTGLRSLAEGGVSNYRNLITNLQKVEELEGKRYKVVLALDMDKYSNKDVMNAEISTVTLLKSLGYQVIILEWNVEEGKGIDDKIHNTGVDGFRFLPV